MRRWLLFGGLFSLVGVQACLVPNLEVGSRDQSSNGGTAATGTAGKASGSAGKANGSAGADANGGSSVGGASEGEGGGSGAGEAGDGGTAGVAGTTANPGGGNTAVGGVSGGGGSAGSPGTSGGGSGGTSGTLCAEHPLTAKVAWIATASSMSSGNGTESDALYNPPAHMTDGSFTERWASGKAQSGDEWVQIDFGAVVTISAVILNVGGDTGDYPRAYAVRLSNTTQDFAAVVRSSGLGATGNTTITFAQPLSGRYLTVKQTGTALGWWAIAEVVVTCSD